MDRPKTTPWFDRVTRGILAGGIGGLAGGGTKLLGELVFPPRVPGEPIPPAVMVSRLLHFFSDAPLLPERQTIAIQLVHWSISAGAGALYGALAERFPRVTLLRGAAFGIVLSLATHQSLLPALGFSLPLAEIPLKEHLSELTTHALYGMTAELVRRLLRRHVVNG